MNEIATEIVIDAPVERVWDILITFNQFQSWNPFIRHAEGDLKEGAILNIHIQPPGSNGMKFKPTVTRITTQRELLWLGHLFVPGLFDGEHIFQIEPMKDGRTQFIQREIFKGFLVPIMWKMMETKTRQGFNEMNAALKNRAEGK